MVHERQVLLGITVVSFLMWFTLTLWLHAEAEHPVGSPFLKSAPLIEVEEEEEAASSASSKDVVRHSRIFLSIASFRDRTCPWTVLRAVRQALFPERLHFSIVQQNNASEDVDCLFWLEQVCSGGGEPLVVKGLEFQGPLSEERKQHACEVARDRTRIKRVDFMEAKGPLIARAWAMEQLLDVETEEDDYFIQVDSHTHFVAAWDVEAMRNWISANDSMAVISVYPDGIPEKGNQGGENSLFRWPQERKGGPPGHEKRHNPIVAKEHVGAYPFNPNEVWLPKFRMALCSGKFVPPPVPMVKFDPVNSFPNPGWTFPSAFFGAGFAMTKLSTITVKQIRYDPYADYVFDGEEFSYSARLWTNGFNFYSPFTTFTYHVYASKVFRLPRYFDYNWNARWVVQKLAEARVMASLGLKVPEKCHENPCANYPKQEFEKFKVGNVRPFEEYMKLIHMTEWGMKEHFSICKEIRSGEWNQKIKKYLPPGWLERKEKQGY